ncbi:MAG: sugar phosphate isomerase/epimerase [Spirochaetales bacterium]|nr:sugar phosphate isomerase/epimerase [Spirochaetales bacterium]
MDAKMKLAVMTNSVQSNRGSKVRTPVVDYMRRLHALGIKEMDLGLAYLLFDDPDITDDNWYEKGCEIRDEAERLGITFVQGHLPFRKKSFNAHNQAEVDYLNSAMLRALRIAGMCKAKWMVVHPVEHPDYPEDAVEEHVMENRRVYGQIMEEAHKYNVGIVFENIPRWNGRGRFGATAADLISVIDNYDDPMVAACWDFGHANINSGDLQTYDIKKLGSRLKTVHVDDNRDLGDDHLCPYLGNIKWENIFKALKEIGFSGYWVFETGMSKNFPSEFKDRSLEFSLSVARYMIEKYNSLELE